MLFHVTWEFIDTSEDGIRRSLEVFSKWQPPAGAEFKGFYGFADGGGGARRRGSRLPRLGRLATRRAGGGELTPPPRGPSSAVLGVREVPAAACVPERALVAVGRDSSGVAQ